MLTIKQEIYTVLDLTKYTLENVNKSKKRRTPVPFLLMSSPGYGKTTDIKSWAEENGYHLETLIGSRFTPEEVMGYQVNEPGAKELVHKNPKWYSRVMDFKKRGVPTVLFCDEVTATPEQTQGPFFDLIFSRTSGDGNKLPDDCLIIAAGNYSLNLSADHNVLSPLINRFCIINLQYERTSMDVINEFLCVEDQIKKCSVLDLSEKTIIDIQDRVYDMFKKMVITYSDTDSSKGVLDFQNQDFSNIYQDSERELLNFWTGRTISNFSYLVEALISCKISNKDMIRLISDGCGGLGTNTFADDRQREKYREMIATTTASIINTVLNGFIKKETKKVKSLNTNDTISSMVQDFIMNKEMITDLTADIDSFVPLYTKICDKYGNVIKTVKEMGNWSETERAQFVSDMDAIQELFKIITPEDSKEFSETFMRIHQDHLSIYAGLTGVSDNFNDYKEVYGSFTPRLIQKIRVAELKQNARQKGGYMKIGERISGASMYFPMGTETAGCATQISKNINKDDIKYFITIDVTGSVVRETV